MKREELRVGMVAHLAAFDQSQSSMQWESWCEEREDSDDDTDWTYNYPVLILDVPEDDDIGFVKIRTFHKSAKIPDTAPFVSFDYQAINAPKAPTAFFTPEGNVPGYITFTKGFATHPSWLEIPKKPKIRSADPSYFERIYNWPVAPMLSTSWTDMPPIFQNFTPPEQSTSRRNNNTGTNDERENERWDMAKHYKWQGVDYP